LITILLSPNPRRDTTTWDSIYTRAAFYFWSNVATESEIECWNRSSGQLWTNIAFNIR